MILLVLVVLVLSIVGNAFAGDFEPSRPQDVGLDNAVIESVLANLAGPIGQRRYQEIHSLILYKDGKLVVDAYFSGNDDYIDFEAGILRKARSGPVQWHKDRLHYVASVNKSITALLAGIAFQQLGLEVQQRVMPRLRSASGLFLDGNALRVTFADLLTMRSGFVWDEWSGEDLVQLWRSQDFVQYLGRKNNQGPGKTWVYNSALPNLLLTVLQAELNQPVAQWADANFFEPLGIAQYRWDEQPNGVPEGAARLFLKPSDMLKIGTLFLNQGQWLGQQIVPAAWIKQMTRQQAVSDAGIYGYYIWLRQLEGRPYFSLDGDGGQYINIFPEQNIIFVITQGNYLEWPLYRDQAEALMKQLLGF